MEFASTCPVEQDQNDESIVRLEEGTAVAKSPISVASEGPGECSPELEDIAEESLSNSRTFKILAGVSVLLFILAIVCFLAVL